MCLWFVCRQSDRNNSVHGCPFLAVIFGAFSVCDDCILKSTKAWLLKLSVLYIHSFMQVHNTTFWIKTVFNNVLFSAEVHNPLHAHLLALSHIYIYNMFFVLRSNGSVNFPLGLIKYTVTVVLQFVQKYNDKKKQSERGRERDSERERERETQRERDN